MVYKVDHSSQSNPPVHVHYDGYDLTVFVKDELTEEAQKHRDNSKHSLMTGLSFGITGGGLAIASLYVTGIIATGLLTGGIALGVIAGIFLLLALVEYASSRKNNSADF